MIFCCFMENNKILKKIKNFQYTHTYAYDLNLMVSIYILDNNDNVFNQALCTVVPLLTFHSISDTSDLQQVGDGEDH